MKMKKPFLLSALAAAAISPASAASVLVDINADGTNRTATAAEFEDAIGLTAGSFSGESVLVFGGSEESGVYTQTVSNVTLAMTGKTGAADNWFGGNSQTGAGSSPNNLLEDGFFLAGNDPSTNSETITISGSGLGLVANTQYSLYLFAGRSQGHRTTFTFDSTSIAPSIPVVGGDETLGTAGFTFNTGSVVPSSLVITWATNLGPNPLDDSGSDDAVFAGFALTTVAVPEPSSLALIGLAGFGLLLRRRRN